MSPQAITTVLLLLHTVAAPLAAEVPEPLRPWVPWVLERHPDLACPRADDTALCVWPGRLRLDLDGAGGSFRLDLEADAEAVVDLPGDAVHWPFEVTLDGKPALLRSRDSRPAVAVAAGRHEIAGRFTWRRTPEALAVPPSVALVDLRLAGRDVARPRREEDGRLWLGETQDEGEEADRLVLAVHRQLADGVPMVLTTRIVLYVTGRARSVELPSPLPDGFVATGLHGGLPSRWLDGSHLLVQVRPGTWQLYLEARSRAPVDEIPFTDRPAPWPREELWAFRANTALRAVEVRGVPGVDSRRTAVPEPWHELPVYRLKPGSRLRLEELSRSDTTRDVLRVARRIWLADHGRYLAVEDVLEGHVYTAGRLEALAPGELGRGQLSHRLERNGHYKPGKLTEQVLTVSAEEGTEARPGLNVRPGPLFLQAEMRYPSGRALPAVGWSHDAERLKAELHLPLGWTLLAAWGADRAGGSWSDGFSTVDVLLLLLVAAASWYRLGRLWGAAVTALFVLGIQEPFGLVAALVWLVFLVTYDREATDGGDVRRTLRWAVPLLSAVLLVVFGAVQWRTGFHPEFQLPLPLHMYNALAGQGLASSGPPTYPDQVSSYERQWLSAVRIRDDNFNPSFYAIPEPGQQIPEGADIRETTDPEEVVQTGFGIPSWMGKTCYLYWDGRVTPEQELRLWLLPPAVELVLSVLRAIAAFALAAWLWGRSGGLPELRGKGSGAPGKAVAGTAAAGLAALLLTLPAEAQVPAGPSPPSLGLLVELEDRLTRLPDCHPSCVEVPLLRLEPDGGELHLSAEVHAAATAVYRLPGPAVNWTPRQVRLDGAETVSLLRDGQGFLALRLPPGRHRVEASGPADAVDLEMPDRPRRLLFGGDGWLLSGAAPGEPPPGAVRLDRLPTADADMGGERRDEPFDPWLELERRIEVGLPWQVHSVLRRRGTDDGVVAVRVPLFDGETVTTPGVTVEDGKALVRLEPGEKARTFRSQLTERDQLRLRAPRDQPWLELWVLDCSPIWACRSEGAPAELRHGAFLGWRPWPGEELRLSFSRPQPAGGPTYTVDRAELEWMPARHRARLDLTVRTSVAGERVLQLPPSARVEAFQVDDEPRPMRFDDGRLRFTLPPGEWQVTVEWAEEGTAGWLTRPPAVTTGAVANVRTGVKVPSRGRVLATGGPGNGSVVESWAWLLLVALGAVVLRRRTTVPVAVHEWLLLALGVLQIPRASALWEGFRWFGIWWPPWPLGLLAFAVVAAWIVLAWKGKQPTFLAAIAIACLCGAVAVGLLAHSTAHVEPVSPEGIPVGGMGDDTLVWYTDRAEEILPRPWVLWLPSWAWRALVLAWTFWLVRQLTAWSPWLFRKLSAPSSPA